MRELEIENEQQMLSTDIKRYFFIHDRNKTDVVKQENQLSNGPRVYQCSPFLVQVVITMQLNTEGYQAVRELQQYAHCSAAVTQYQTVKDRWTKGHNQHGNI